MKACPNCKTEYSDDLFYCLQDGTPLVPAYGVEEPTLVRPDVRVAQTTPAARRGRSTASIVAVTAAAMLVIFGIAAAGLFMYFRKSNGETARTTANVTINTPKPSPSAPVTPRPEQTTPANTPANSTTPGSAADEEAVIEEVTQRVHDWADQTEDLNIDAYMSNYAARVDYYQRSSVSRDAVRADKERAFGVYDSVTLDISNADYKVDPSGRRATATFDKSWDFQGETRSRGKVRQMLRFELIGGRWLITAEKDLKLYYKN